MPAILLACVLIDLDWHLALGAKLSFGQYFSSARNAERSHVISFPLLLRFIMCLGVMVFAQPAFAVPMLQLPDAPTEVDLTPYLSLFEDVEKGLSVNDMREPDFDSRFEALKDGKSNYGFSDSAWWVRFKVKNTSDERRELTVRLDYPLLDHVDFWVFSAGRASQSWQTGNRRPFSTRAIPHRDFLFPLSLAADEEQTVYMRIDTNGPVNIGLTLFGQETLQPKIQTEYMVLGAYFGGFLLLALCILLLYLMDLQQAFLYYLAYIVSYAGYMLAFNGLAFQYFWPGAPELGQIARPVLLTLSIIFLLQFSRSLLGIKDASQLLFKSVSALQAVLVIVLLFIPLFGYGTLVMPIAALLLFALVMVLAMGVVAHRAGKVAARYYLLAWSVFLGGLLIYLLKVFGLLPHNFVTHYGFQIGSFFEFIFLSGALVVRVRELRVQSHADGLTGLANRRSFDEELAEEFALSARPESELSLLVIDVDHFKKFNDTFGHAAGDTVLKELGQLFKRQTRRPGQAYRYGGEEFAVLLPRTRLDEALIVAERLRKHASMELSFDNVTVSVGVVSLKGGGFSSAKEFFKAGDGALYQAKTDGRNRVVAFRAATTSDTITPPEQSNLTTENG